jgi:hypothetical protein
MVARQPRVAEYPDVTELHDGVYCRLAQTSERFGDDVSRKEARGGDRNGCEGYRGDGRRDVAGERDRRHGDRWERNAVKHTGRWRDLW